MLAQKVRVNVDEIDTLYKLKVLVFEAKLSVIIGWNDSLPEKSIENIIKLMKKLYMRVNKMGGVVKVEI